MAGFHKDKLLSRCKATVRKLSADLFCGAISQHLGMPAPGPRLPSSDLADRVLQWLYAEGPCSQNVQAIRKIAIFFFLFLNT